MSITISKKNFLSNLTEFVWVGNGNCDILRDGEADICEKPHPVLNKWMDEWVAEFNKKNPHLPLKWCVNGEGEHAYYHLEVIKPTKIHLPHIEPEEDEFCEVQSADAGAIVRECREDEDSDSEDEDDDSEDEDSDPEDEDDEDSLSDSSITKEGRDFKLLMAASKAHAAKREFKCRCECEADITCFLSECEDREIAIEVEKTTTHKMDLGEGKMVSVPDCSFTFKTTADLGTLEEVLDSITDAHVMRETLTYKENYTGVRVRKSK